MNIWIKCRVCKKLRNNYHTSCTICKTKKYDICNCEFIEQFEDHIYDEFKNSIKYKNHLRLSDILTPDEIYRYETESFLCADYEDEPDADSDYY